MRKAFHFSLGDSTKGPIGFCAEVDAETFKEAAEKLRKVLPESQEIILNDHPDVNLDDIGYVRVYFNEGYKFTKKSLGEEPRELLPPIPRPKH